MQPLGMRPVALPSQPLSQPQVTPQQPLSSSSHPPQSAGANQFVYRQGIPNQMHHDPTAFPMQMNADPELFLSGFHFQCFDSEKLFEDRLDRKTLEFMIRVRQIHDMNQLIQLKFQFHGGEIEFDNTRFLDNVHLVSHVLIDSCRNPHVRQSLEHRKRIISMQWVVDVIQREKADIPWKLAHLPAPFNDNFRPYLGKV